jgi:predicted nucleic acid-binding protein
MIRRAVVIDTNVIISAHLTSRPESPTVWILDAMIAARFPFLVSVELLAEYRRVLLRQPIREKHGVSADKRSTGSSSSRRPPALLPRTQAISTSGTFSRPGREPSW